MNKNTVISLKDRAEISDPFNDLLRSGARLLIEQAIKSELQEMLSQYTDQGHAVVVRNGYLPERSIQTGIGPVTVKAPKIRSRSGEPVTFRSALVPPYLRKTRSLEAAIPWLYLKGVSSGEMSEALKVLLGPGASGLSANTVSRLKQVWGQEYQNWRGSDLSKASWVYIWADGIYSGLKPEDTKLCCLVIIGVNEGGEKHFLAIEDGVRESTQSWREVLLKLKSRGMKPPKLGIGDGAMGFWAALEEIYPDTRHQRCWMHKTCNVLNALLKSLQAKGKEALHDIWQADTRKNSVDAFELFVKTYEAKYPKATLCLQKEALPLIEGVKIIGVHSVGRGQGPQDENKWHLKIAFCSGISTADFDHFDAAVEPFCRAITDF